MPLESSDFPEEVQVAFFISSLLPDRYDSNVGIYLGKDWASVASVFEYFEVSDPKTTFYLMKLFEIARVDDSADKYERQQKKSRQKEQSGGKQYTHNVSG